MYKLCPKNLNDVQDMVQNLQTMGFIPFDERNTEYQQYLKWLAEGNTPELADE